MLDLVSRRHAILPVDDCDVFLQARSVPDIQRDRTILALLHVLEHYEVIITISK